MVYEDFTGYVENDGLGTITVTATKVSTTYCDMRSSTDQHVCKDYGLDHFADFDHKFECSLEQTVDSTLAARAGIIAYVEQDVHDDKVALKTGNYEVIILWWNWDDTANKPRVHLEEFVNNSVIDSDNSVELVIGTRYYFQIVRSGTSLTVYIRTGSHSGSLIDTLTITLNSATRKYRWLEVVISMGYSSSRNSQLYVENLDLQEVAPTLPKIKRLGVIGVALEDIDISEGEKVIIV